MQQPQTDHTQPATQYSSPHYHQMQPPPMMLCPVGVQYVYEPQMVQVPQEEPTQPSLNQTFQNQTLLLQNVQNTPPWIQNQSNMVYMPQMQMASNIQPYIPQQMVQSPMYQYQYQPMIMQEQRLPNYMNQNVIQSPQMVQNVVQSPQIVQHVIQNPQTLIQNPQNVINTQNIIQHNQNPVRYQQIEQKQEQPILTAHVLQNHVIKTTNPNEFVSSPMIIRPQYQNVQPQMIIVNPIPPPHTCTHNQQKDLPIIIETQQNEVPQHIRNQIPEGLSVKTVIKPAATALVKPTEYTLQNIAPADEAHPRVYPKPTVKPVSNRDPQTNYKRKIREIIEMNNKDESEIEAFKRNCLINRQEAALNKHIKMKTYFDAANQSPNNLNTGPVERSQIIQNSTDRPPMEEKLLRNTVYVQARGRVNEIQNTNAVSNQRMEINNENQLQNNVTERVNLPVETVMILKEQLVSNSVEQEVAIENSQNNEVKINQTVILNNVGKLTGQSLKSTEIVHNDRNSTESQNNSKTPQLLSNDTDKTTIRNNSKTPPLLSNEVDDKSIRNNSKMSQILLSYNADGIQNNSKVTEITLPNADDAKTRNISKNTKILSKDAKSKKTKISKKPKNNKVKKNKKADTKEMVSAKSNDIKEPMIEKYVLTHVLDGHIIQESNVPFVVQKPTMSPIKVPPKTIKKSESEAVPSRDTKSKNNIEESNSLNIETTEPSDNGETDSRNAIGEAPVINKKKEIDVEPKLTANSKTINHDNDDPFINLSVATVKSWSDSDLTSHLMKYQDWQESAQKLREEEIDGESLFLVNKEQLLHIGICEEHTQAISEFLERD